MWNDDLVTIFCEIYVKEVAKGNRSDTHFDKIGWVNAVNVFKEIIGRDYDKMQLKNKWDSLKIDWKLWSLLLHKYTGIGWVPAMKTVDVHLECDVGISPDMMDMYDKIFKDSTVIGNCGMIPSSTRLLEEMVGDSEHDRQTVSRENEEALQGEEKGSQLLWFATELFCSQDKREMFSVITDSDLKLQFLILNQTKVGN
ncbi:hypothetical protein Ddye_029691 [Dipteronia dyeriana]|uniref:Myb/SANT-like domain-containing protein n=1 Tax=Dipteronia dyeriana TaxID=168575 RepID=A0AAD9TEW7_9ROSI|nr:hypothetical protein Ddye_029691 [Dipteronia dyeriana]